MSSTNKRKAVITKNKKNNLNKKVATGEAIDEESKKSPDMSVKTKELNSEITKKEEEVDQQQRLLVIQDKTAELEKQLNELKSDYEKEKKESIEQVNSINTELNKKVQETKKLGKENKILINKLKNIEKGLYDKYIKAMNIKLIKKNKDIKDENTFKKDIKVHEELIKIMLKEQKRENKHQEKFINDIQKYYESVKELDSLEEEIQNLNQQIYELKKNKEENQKNLKEIEYREKEENTKKLQIKDEEIKKEHEIVKEKETQVLKDNCKVLKENLKITNILSDPPVVERYNYSKEIRDKVLKMEFPRVKPASKSVIRYINTEFDLINQRNKSFKNLLGTKSMPTSVIDNVYKQQDNLFTDRENKVFEKFFIKENMQNYVDNFDKAKKERDKILEKYEQQFNDIKKEKPKMMCDIDFNKMEKKAKDIIETQLNVKIIKNNKKISELNIAIFEMKKKLEQQNFILKRKEKQNKVYMNLIENIKKNKNKNNKDNNDKVKKQN